tara:strand:+ start:171 stop:374 length:204 start_codon:yes stop_codon:yes gene_type:complete
MSSIRKEMELAKYKNLLSINNKALISVSDNQECIKEFDMPLYALEDIVSYLKEQVAQTELEIEEMLS